MEKARFIHMVAAFLDEHEAKGDYDTLILFAPPPCLHQFRESLREAVKRKVKHEAPHDLTKLPLSELPQHIEKLRWT
jgi:protein required for attachment to host cells